MGLFGGSKNENILETLENEVKELLFDGETIEEIYPLLLDFVCLTNKRVILVDKKLTSSEVFIYSIPYSKIEEISMEKGKMLTLSNQIEIMTKAKTHDLKFIKGTNTSVLDFYKKVCKHIC